MSWAAAAGQADAVPAASSGDPRERVSRQLKITRLVVALTVFIGGAATAAGVLGYGWARQSDAWHAEAQRDSLRAAMAEFRELAVNGSDPRLLAVIERSTGVQGLRFETELGEDNRDTLPVLNAEGRIAGFLTWQPDAPMTATLNRLLPVAIGMSLLLAGFAAVSIGQLRRGRRDLANSLAQARRAAQVDPLTGLPNSTRLVELLGAVLEQRQDREIVTLCLVELSNLKQLADQIGDHGCNDVIATSADRLSQALPAGAFCGRMNDGFGIIFSGDIDVDSQMRMLFAALERPQWLDTVLHVVAHAGYAQAPRDATTADDLLRRADLALRAAARKGAGSITGFEPSIDAKADLDRFILRELPRALAAEALTLHYQPIIAAESGRIVGVEALARWRHSERGDIAPGAFIPVAEQRGLMKPLGEFVLRRALSEADRWPDCYVAINMSPVQLRDPGIVDLVRSLLREARVEPSRLLLEITEGMLIDNPEEMIVRIKALRDLGLRIALDDFGSGYSNLGYLQRFPFDKLKIDRSFVSPLRSLGNASVVLQAMVGLGRALGVSVLAEGVETEEQRVLLRLAGCDEMQGFLFARPMPAVAAERLIDAHRIAQPAALTA
ncbi:MAG: GGDEF domain-containing protein [Pseudolabrys sp.]|nr:GGDEF domain-containing protein [Pseudolabrys sp.]